jgi:hypothetical protein
MSTVEAVSRVSRGLISREQTRGGGSFDDAVSRVARRIRTGPGSLANIVRQRVKSVSSDIRDRIVLEALAALQRDIARLEHEKQLLLQMGAGSDHRDLCALESALATVQATLDQIGGGRT